MATITKNFTFSAGATIVAADHNSNFDTIYNDYNGNITNANISASAAIVASKLSLATIAQTMAMSSVAINWAKGSDIASATTTDIGAMSGNYGDVTGTTTITGLGTVQAGTFRVVRFTGALTLTHNATSLLLPNNASNITTAANDTAGFVSLASGNWKCVWYQKYNGQALAVGTATGSLTAGTTGEQDPWTASAKTTTAHGLSVTPQIVIAYLQCLTAELGYVASYRVDLNLAAVAADSGSIIQWDATNTVIISHSARPYVVNKTTPAGMVQITAANWKVVVVPYKIN